MVDEEETKFGRLDYCGVEWKSVSQVMVEEYESEEIIAGTRDPIKDYNENKNTRESPRLGCESNSAVTNRLRRQ